MMTKIEPHRGSRQILLSLPMKIITGNSEYPGTSSSIRLWLIFIFREGRLADTILPSYRDPAYFSLEGFDFGDSFVRIVP